MNENLTKLVVEKFSDLRHKEEMTLQESADTVSCSRSHLSDVLSYRSKPSEQLAFHMFTQVVRNSKIPYPVCKNR